MLQVVQSTARAVASRDQRAALLMDLGEELQRMLHKFKANITAESVHDVRVATRRLRAVLRTFRKEVQPALYDSLRFDLKQIARTLEPARTASVRLSQSTKLFARDRRDRQRDVAQLTALFERMLQRGHRELATTIEENPWRKRTERILQQLRDPDLLLASNMPARASFHRILLRSLRRLRSSIERARRRPRALHRQRIEIKNTRYVLEAFASSIGLDSRRALEEMRTAQNTLGQARDWSNLGDWLHAVAIGTPLHSEISKQADKRFDKHAARFRKQRPILVKRIDELIRALES